MSPVIIQEKVCIPAWVVDLESFRRWACSDDFPEHGWFSHIKGKLWVDVSMETVPHNQLKAEVAFVLTALAEGKPIGEILPRSDACHERAGRDFDRAGCHVL